jgi:WhiB family transcriptional regulator, redox-sensing transcriptional regulator
VNERAAVRPRRGQLGAPLTAEGGWWLLAACRYEDPDLFFPVSAIGKSLQQAAEAKAVCAGCPVRAECLAFALRTKQVHGIWGGMTEEERRQAAKPGEREAWMPQERPGLGAFADDRVPEEAGAAACQGPGGVNAASRDAGADPGRHYPAAWVEELAERLAMAARAACSRMTPPALEELRASVERASRLSAGAGWQRKATAHVEIFRMLADMATEPAADVLRRAGSLTRDLMITVGPVANSMTVTSRQRLLADLRAGDADGAAREMESHLRVLHFMGRLAGGAGQARADDPEPRTAAS